MPDFPLQIGTKSWVRVTGDTAPAGYRRVGGVAYADYDSVFATFDPLPLGDYTVHIKMNELVNGEVSPLCPEPDLAFTVRSEPGATQTTAVVEFYHAVLDHYVITQNPAEMADLDSGVHAGWTRTGYSFAAYLPGEIGCTRESRLPLVCQSRKR